MLPVPPAGYSDLIFSSDRKALDLVLVFVMCRSRKRLSSDDNSYHPLGPKSDLNEVITRGRDQDWDEDPT